MEHLLELEKMVTQEDLVEGQEAITMHHIQAVKELQVKDLMEVIIQQ